MPCAFCESPDTTTACAWPVDRVESIPFTDLKPGDRYLPFEGAKRPATVVRVIARPDNGEVEVVTDALSYFVAPWKPVLRAVASTCGRPACWRCSREVADGLAYCREHWGAWEKVA